MHVIYDNLIAVLISGFLLLILVQLNRNGNQTRVNTTRYYAGRAQATSFIETLQRDFRNIGSGVDAADDMISAFQWDQVDTFIEFYATIEPDPEPPAAPAPVKRIRYEKVSAPDCQTRVSRTAPPVTIPCFRVVRSVYDGTQFVEEGGSMDTITDFAIDVRRANGASAASNLEEARAIVVRMEALSPLGEDGIIKRTRWQTRLQPTNLTRKD